MKQLFKEDSTETFVLKCFDQCNQMKQLFKEDSTETLRTAFERFLVRKMKQLFKEDSTETINLGLLFRSKRDEAAV